MAKAKVNKSQMIRDALEAHPSKSPVEIAEVLKGQGLNVLPQYVSTIKSNFKKKKKGKGKAAKRKVAAASNSLEAVGAAVEFIKAAGGLEQAKAAISTVEVIRGL